MKIRIIRWFLVSMALAGFCRCSQVVLADGKWRLQKDGDITLPFPGSDSGTSLCDGSDPNSGWSQIGRWSYSVDNAGANPGSFQAHAKATNTSWDGYYCRT